MSERIPPKGRRAAKAAPVRSDQARSGSARAADRSRRASPGRDSRSPGAISAAPLPVGPRRERYLVAALRPAPGTVGWNGWPAGNGLADPPAPPGDAAGAAEPAGVEELLTHLRADPSCVIHRVIAPSGPAGPLFPPVAVVDMDADRAAMLALSGPMLHVEPDLPLQYGRAAVTRGLSFADPGVVPHGEGRTVVIAVVGGDGKAMDGADIYLLSEAFPVRGSTDAAGTVTLELPASPLRGLYVRPRSDHWAVWLGRPDLNLDRPNLVSCPAFAETFPGFPERPLDSWAARALRFDSVPPTFRGHGVRIAILDSGAAVEHPDLTGRLAGGWGPEAAPADDTGDADTDLPNWGVDTVGNGSHSAGIIGGSDNGHGIVGVVPEAEIHVGRLFPGGRFSDLIDAFDYCVATQIDLVDLGLCSPQPSELLARKIEQLRQAGIACVAAAGSSGGPVAFPASLPSVLAVAAIGKTGEYPPESYHATQVRGVPTPEGYFSAAFTCFGPEIDVCAPGVAVVSSVPTTNYAALDGTSTAAAYVSGFAALLLAHHAEFRNRFRTRDARRVDRLFELIRSSCRPLHLGEAGRAGAGLPDAAVAFGLARPLFSPVNADPAMALIWAAMAQPGGVRGAQFGLEPPSGFATGNGAAFSTGADDVMAPLRAALSAAGLLPMADGVAVESAHG